MDETPLVIEASAPVKTIPVELVGVHYDLHPPKGALAMKLARSAKQAKDKTQLLDILDEWIVKAFGKQQAAKVQKRLDDPDDLLDIQHLMQLMKAVIERATGNPTS